MRVVIVGAGFGGIGAAIELRRHGFDDVVILDRAPELGGTWHYNDYPGRGLRRPEPPVLVLVRAAPRLDAAVLAARRDPRLPARGRARPRRRPARRAGHARSRARPTTGSWTIESGDGRTWEADALIVATGQLHRTHFPRHRPGRSPATASTRPSGTTTTTCAASAWRWSARARAPCSSCRRSPSRSSGSSSSSARATGSCRARNRPYPRWFRALVKVPGVQAFRRRFIFWYGESLTLMIRHPRTWGRIGRARSAVFMRWQLRDRELRRKVWPDYTFGCKRVLFSSHFLPALQRPNVELVTDAGHRADVTTASSPTDGEHEVDCIIYAHRLPRHRLHVPDGDRRPRRASRCARRGRTARTRTSGSPCPASRRCT